MRNLKYDEKKSLNYFLIEFEKTVSELRNAGGRIDTRELITQLLSVMPPSYAAVTSALDILFSQDEKAVTLELVKNKLLMEEARQNENKSKSSEEGPIAFANFRHKYRNKSKKFNQKRTESNQQNQLEFPYKCHHCHEKGHIRKNCPKLKMNGNSSIAEEEITFLSVEKTEALSTHTKLGTLVMIADSGSSHHLIREDLGYHLVDAKNVDLKIGVAKEGQTINAHRCGKLILKTKQNRQITIENVYECKNLTYNLLSIRVIERKGMKVTFESGEVKIRNQYGNLLLTGNLDGNLYKFEFITTECQANSCIVDKDLLHRRMGHAASFPPLKTPCNICLEGKQTRNRFISMPEDRKPKRILEVVSTDVCGPLNPQTHDDKRYFVTFIDHYSHFAIGHLIEKKSEVTDLFIQYEAMVTAKFGCSIEKL